MVKWLVLYVAIHPKEPSTSLSLCRRGLTLKRSELKCNKLCKQWHAAGAAGIPLQEARLSHDLADLSTSNIDMLIPLIFGNQLESRARSHTSKRRPPMFKPRLPDFDDRYDEPFSGIPSEEFVLDEPLFMSQNSNSKKKDLSRVMDDNLPLSVYLNRHRDREIRASEAKKVLSHDIYDVPITIYLQNRAEEGVGEGLSPAENLANEVMFYLCGELFDAMKSRNQGENVLEDMNDCRECCPHLHTLVQDGRARGVGVGAKGQGQDGRGSDNQSGGRGSLSLFGPVGGRRDWMVVKEKFPGMMQHYIKTGKKPLKIYKPY